MSRQPHRRDPLLEPTYAREQGWINLQSRAWLPTDPPVTLDPKLFPLREWIRTVVITPTRVEFNYEDVS